MRSRHDSTTASARREAKARFAPLNSQFLLSLGELTPLVSGRDTLNQRHAPARPGGESQQSRALAERKVPTRPIWVTTGSRVKRKNEPAAIHTRETEECTKAVNVERLLDLMRAAPFAPLSIVLPNGERLPAPHPDYIWVHPDRRTIIVVLPNGATRFLNHQMVAALEMEAMPA